MSDTNDLKGLKGWLILVGIGVVVSPFRLAYDFLPMYYSIFTDGTYEILTTAGGEAYHPLWGPLLIGELLYNSLIVLAPAYLIFLYFIKHYLFPKIYIFILTISLVFIPLDSWPGSFVLPDEDMFDSDTIKNLVRAIVGAAFWVPYMLLSERVKATFVEYIPEQIGNKNIVN